MLFDKANIFPIVKDHIYTLKDNRTDKISPSDIILFFVFPGVIAPLLVYLGFCIDKDVRNIMATSMAVFVALLFNVLLLIYDVVSRKESYDESSVIRRVLLKEVYSNIAFAILVAILSLVLLLMTAFVEELVIEILSGIIYYLAGVFILTLMMVLKRIHSLFNDQFSNPPVNN